MPLPVAVFDTVAFHQTLDANPAYIYPLPGIITRNWGFAVMAFMAPAISMSAAFWRKKLGVPTQRALRVICCHLGNGSSIRAIKNGRSVNTSMGFTPQSGVMMGNP